MKVIFADFDGVLNSGNWMRERRKFMKLEDKIIGDPESEAKWILEPARVALLNQALERTGALVVVSSSWRGGGHGVEMLRFAGLTPDAIGETVHARTDLGLEYQPNTRSESLRPPEIMHWVDTHPEIDSYLVLDDVDLKMERLVLIDGMYGIQQSHVELIVDRLGARVS